MKGPVAGGKLAVFDLETTGVDTKSCGIVSIAIIHIDFLCRPGSAHYAPPRLVFNSYCDPGMEIPEGAARVHGITQEVLDANNAPSTRQLLTQIREGGFFEDRIVAAYNLPFDMRVMRRLVPNFPDKGLDPYVWVKRLDKYEKGKKLADACGRRGIVLENAHDAAADVMATAHLIPRLLSELKDRSDSRMRGQKQYIHMDRACLLDAEAFWEWQAKTAMTAEKENAAYRAKQKLAPFDSNPWSDGFGQGGR